MNKTNRILTAIISFFVLIAGSLQAQPTDASATDTKVQYETQVRETLALDYSMPDYSIKKINAKVMGPRLATILNTVNENYQQPKYLNRLSLMQKKPDC